MIGSKHHYLGNTEDVIAAGQIKINGHGMVKRIDNLSEHYQPSVYQAMQYQGLFRDLLVDQGIELYNLDIYMFPIEENKNYNSTDDMFRLVICNPLSELHTKKLTFDRTVRILTWKRDVYPMWVDIYISKTIQKYICILVEGLGNIVTYACVRIEAFHHLE